MSTYAPARDQFPLTGPIIVEDAPIFYRQAGAGSRTPLILLHGWGGSSRYWRSILTELSADRRVLAPDLPGFGESPPLKGQADTGRMAELVLAFADAMGLEQFDLNGHSFSGSVAIFLAARHPERVRRIVLTCVSVFRNERERRIVDQIHKILGVWMGLRRPWMVDMRPFQRAAASLFFHKTPTDVSILRESFADFIKMDQRTALITASDAGNPAIKPAMRAIHAPALVIGARQDKIMPPANTPEIVRLIPNSRLIWIEQCGHFPMLEYSAHYTSLVTGFLDQA